MLQDFFKHVTTVLLDNKHWQKNFDVLLYCKLCSVSYTSFSSYWSSD